MSLSTRMRRSALLLTAATAFTLMQAPALAQEFGGLGHATATGEFSYAEDISADGRVIVGAVRANGEQVAAFWNDGGDFVTLGDLGGGPVYSYAEAASADGSVIVGYGTTADGMQALRWSGGVMSAIPLSPGAGSSRAYDVSADGAVIVGAESVNSRGQAFRWTEAGGMQWLTPLAPGAASIARAVSADGAVIVGASGNASGSLEAFRWTESAGMTTLGFLPGDIGSQATDISSDGQVIVGESVRPGLDPRSEAVRWTNADGIVGLGFVSGHDNSRALAVSGNGYVIVGTSSNSMTGEAEAFFWDEEFLMESITDFLALDGLDLGSWELQAATGVSYDGNIIVGTGTNPDGFTEGWYVRLRGASPPPPPPPPAGANFAGMGVGASVIGLSGDGNVAVGAMTSGTSTEAFSWTPSGGRVVLGDLAGGNALSVARSASADGSVIVGFASGANGEEAVRWDNGVITSIGGGSGASSSQAYGVSADGSVIVGVNFFSNGDVEGFRWTESTGAVSVSHMGSANRTRALGVSADGATVVGESVNPQGFNEAFLSDGSLMTRLGMLPGYELSSAVAADADGSVVIGSSSMATSARSQAFRWEGGQMQPLGFLAGRDTSVARAVNSDGTVIVGVSGAGSPREAFYWTAADDMRSVEDVLASASVDIGTWQLQDAVGLSADGRVIVGMGLNPSGQNEAWWARISAGEDPGDPPDEPQQPPGFISLNVIRSSVESTTSANTSHGGGSTVVGVAGQSWAREGAREGNLVGGFFNSAAGDASGPRTRARELTAFVNAGTAVFNGDISDADSIDAMWGLSYQATRDLRVATAYRYVSLDGVLPAYDGEVELEGRSLQALVAYEPEASGLRLYVGGSYAQNESTVVRGYLNGVTPDSSTGSRDGDVFGGMVMAGWNMPLGGINLMPFVRYDATRIELEEYAETGGAFPARFDAWDDVTEVSRLGFEGRAPLTNALEAIGSIAWGHRSDNRPAPITGEIIDLTPFNVESREVEQDWTEASADLIWSARDGVNVRVGVAASTDGDTAASVSGFVGVDMRL